MSFVISDIPRVGSIKLSAGAVSPYEIPNDFGQITFPLDASVSCNFYDTSGNQVLVVAGTVYADRIQFLFMPADVDVIKRGYNFEVFLTASDSKLYKLRYGKVVRREVSVL